MDKEMRNFFWGSSGSPLVAWEQICLPKSNGGLGIRPVSCFNKAALAKLGWKVITDPNNWWVEIVRKKYLRRFSFFEVPKQSHQSFAWKGILDSRDIILKGMRWIIGNGHSIKFWTFTWIYDFPLIQLVDATTRASIDLDESVSDYLVNGVWNIEKLSQYLESSIVRDISFVNLPFSDREDEFVWGPSSDGKFSIKSATWFQCNQNVHPKANFLNKIWKLNIPPKEKIFAWLLVRDRLKTRARLARFNSSINPICGLCNNDVENLDHIFRSCPKVSDVWSMANLNQSPTTFNCFDDWIVYMFQNTPMDALENCLLLCWQIWKKRNDVLFRDSGFSPASVVHASASFCAAYRTHNSATTSISLSDVIKWHPPPENFVKLNFDGSVSSSNLAAAGFVIRNHFGDPIVAGSRSIGSSTVPLAECTALKDGLLVAKRFNLDHILVEGDSSLIINCVNLKCEAPWMLKSLLKDIASIANSFTSISFSHVFREANFLADAVTSTGSGSSPRVWLQCLPVLALPALYWDKFSFGCPRGFSLFAIGAEKILALDILACLTKAGEEKGDSAHEEKGDTS